MAGGEGLYPRKALQSKVEHQVSRKEHGANTPGILALRRLWQEDCCTLEASWGCIVSSTPKWTLSPEAKEGRREEEVEPTE